MPSRSSQSETDRLLSKREPEFDTLSGDPPSDRYNAVYIIFYILGIATLLPWNFYSNAKHYFEYKLRNETVANFSNYLDPVLQTPLMVMFESYLTVCAMVPNVLFMFLNTAATKVISLKVRIVVASVVIAITFVFSIALTKINTDNWQYEFFVITMASIIIMNAGSAVLQGGVFGLSGMFGKEQTQAVMGGMGMGGIIASVSNVVVIAISTNPLSSGFGYFITAEMFVLIALFGYLVLPKIKFARYSLQKYKERSISVTVTSSLETNVESSGAGLISSSDYGATITTSEIDSVSIRQPMSMFAIFKKIWREALCVFFIFLVTLSCYPAVNSAIISNYNKNSRWARDFFVPVSCFVIFNVGDWIGRTIPGITQMCDFQWPKAGSVWLPILSFLRVGFIPLFLLCNVQPRSSHLPVIFFNDFIPMALMLVFAISNGHLSTLCMMYGPRRVPMWEVETAGAMMSFFLSSGLAAGSLISLALVTMIKWGN